MLRQTIALMTILAWALHGDSGAEAQPAVYVVATKAESFKRPGSFDIDLQYFSVRLPSPLAQARMNLQLRELALGDRMNWASHGYDRKSCTADLATTVLISLTCTTDFRNEDDRVSMFSGGVREYRMRGSYVLSGDEVKLLRMRDLFADPGPGGARSAAEVICSQQSL